MHKDMKKRVILDNLEAFADKLMIMMGDESIEGQKRMLSIIQSAKDLYGQPLASWSTHFIYQFTRGRLPAIDQSIHQMKAMTSIEARLVAFKQLVQQGKWNEGSFNYFLFDKLIEAIPGHDPLKNEVRKEVITRLHQLLAERIDQFLQDYQAAQKQIEQRKNECKSAVSPQEKLLDNLYVFDSLSKAKQAVNESPHSVVFYLTSNNKRWTLYWLDAIGGSHPLELPQELNTLLTTQAITPWSALKPQLMQKIKKECLKAKTLFLEKMPLLINPPHLLTENEPNQMSFHQKKPSSTFILQGEKGQYALHWINSLGQTNPIALANYPKLHEWLSAHESVQEAEKDVLKTYLLQVNTNKALGMAEFKKQLALCLTNGPLVQEKKPIAPHGRLNLNLFKHIEHCFSGHPVGEEKKSTVNGFQSLMKNPNQFNPEYFSTETSHTKEKLDQLEPSGLEDAHPLNP